MPDTRKNHNPSGAPDPTRVRAESNIQREEARVSELVHVLRYVAGAAGFEIVERIVLVDNQTGGSIGEQNEKRVGRLCLESGDRVSERLSVLLCKEKRDTVCKRLAPKFGRETESSAGGRKAL